MTARCIIQLNHETGEKNVCLTQDYLSPVEDFLVAWPDTSVVDGKVIMIAEDIKIDNLLCDTELRSVSNSAELVPVTFEVTESGMNRLKEFLV
jgi:hypothetical protein